MLVFLSVLGIIVMVGVCCLCLAPNSTMLNAKRMWMEIKLSDAEEVLYAEAEAAYDARRNKVRERRRKRNRQNNLQEARRGANGSANEVIREPLERAASEEGS